MPTDSIEQNLLAGSTTFIDQINADFYGRFPFPWRPSIVICASDQDFARIMLNQNLGDWSHRLIPQNPRIWIAGCGTNQAAIMALQFPAAELLGSDISGPSLQNCAAIAKELDIVNLELRKESINEARYCQQFDYVVCTGVIHHNADPPATLYRLAQSLKPAGVLELMVYNRYHRIQTSAFQRAVRLLANTAGDKPDFEKQLFITRSLVERCSLDGFMGELLADLKDAPDEQLADSLMQPVENSYTIETLQQMADECGLELVTPCLSPWDKANGSYSWNLRLPQADLQNSYDQLPDFQRWQITNLLLFERSPFLWFYLKRKDSSSPRMSEKQICQSFLQQRFAPVALERRVFALGKDTPWEVAAKPYPGTPAASDLRKIVAAADEKTPIGRILEHLGIQLDFATINDLRLRLTTSAFSYLMAVNT